MNPFPTTAVSRRTVAGLAAAALSLPLVFATPAGAAPAPAVTVAADDAAPTLSWRVSDQFVAHFAPASFNQNTFVASDGATLDANSTTIFGNGTGWVATNGDAQLSYEGTITGSFIVGAPQYSIAISDPTVTIKDGKGSINADLDWSVPRETPASGSAANVLVTTFDATGATTDRTITATPAWEGVLPAGSEAATALGFAADRPVDGKAFAPEFLGALPASLRGHFYASGVSADSRKAPSAFTATAPTPALTAEVSPVTADGATVRVQGTGFAKQNPGIYVGVTEAGPIDPTNAALYRGTIWLPNAAINADGSFDRELTLSKADLEGFAPDAELEIHAQKAHGQSATDASQNVRLPITVTPQVTTSLAVSDVTTQHGVGGARVTVTATGAETGRVAIDFNGTPRAATLVDGTAVLAIPAATTAGIYTVRATLPGSGKFTAAATATGRVTVRSAQTSTAASYTAPTSTATGKADIRVTHTGSTTRPTGTVTLTISNSTTTRTLTRTLVSGRTNPTLPKLPAGSYRVVAKYNGEAGKFLGSQRTTIVRVTR